MSAFAIILATSTVAITAPAQAATVVEAFNENAVASNATWGASNVGWFYTPTTSYQLSGLATRFGSVTGIRTVGAAIYSGSPGSLSLLGDGTLTAGTAFAEAMFAAPVSLTSGTQYFFAFTNVSSLGVNVTDDAGATNLAGGLRYDGSVTPIFNLGPETGFTAQPIVQFLGVASAVPEPATWAMMLLGLGFIGGAMRTRRTTKINFRTA